MSLEGKATQDTVLRGKINSLDVLTIDAYGVAVRNGFEGTEAEWLASLKGEKGDKGDVEVDSEIIEGSPNPVSGGAIFELLKSAASKIAYVDLPASGWQGEQSPYSQVVAVEGATENSQVDLTPSVEQLTVFYNKDLAFVTENENGVVTVYAIGQKPANDYTIQVTITEVVR